MDESVKRTTIGGRRLFPIPICEIIETPLTLDLFAISVAKEGAIEASVANGETSPSIDDRNEVCATLSKYAQLVSRIKVYPSDVKQP